MGCAPHELHERFYAKHALTGDGKEPAELWGRVGSKLRSFFLDSGRAGNPVERPLYSMANGPSLMLGP